MIIVSGENLIDVIERVKKYYTEFILPFLEANKNVLIVAHGNSIRALLVVLEVFSTPVACRAYNVTKSGHRKVGALLAPILGN